MPSRSVFLGGLAAAAALGGSAGRTLAQSASPSPSPTPVPTPEPPLPGRTILRPFATAPFPDKSRANGHDYDGKHYDAATYYSDSTVGIYVPSYFRPGHATDLIVHFHGWDNHVSMVLQRYELREQLEASRLNAILVVPQGPKDAPDSGDGKIELDDDGFARFVASVLDYLHASKIVPGTALGKLVVTAHSGGYGAVGGLLTRGGLNDKITDVLLYDALYGYFDAFANWVRGNVSRHFLSLYTTYTAVDNATVMAMMQAPKPNLMVFDSHAMTLAQLQTRAPTFIYTDVAHDELLQQKHWFELFLKTTTLRA